MINKKITLGGFIVTAIVVIFFSGSYIPTTLAAIDDVTADVSSKTNSNYAEIIQSKTSNQNLSLIEIFETTEQGVVSITVQKSTDLFEKNGIGSGIVYDNQGYIITNNHVIENAEKIIVTFIEGTSFNGKTVGVDPFTDIAVIKVEAPVSILNPLKFGDSLLLKVGEHVTAIGNPFGLSGSMTSGIVSQLGRNLPAQGTGFLIPEVIQTDSAINPGNSGGPLLNMKGEVVGINTAIYSRTGDFSGVGFSIPSNTVSKIVPSLISNGTYDHPWIGITSVDIDPDLAKILELKQAKGIQVISVVQNSPAQKAGIVGSSIIKEINDSKYTIGGDIIVEIDGKEVRKIDDILTHLQREKSVGDTTMLKILRDGQPMEIKITLEQRPK